MEVTTARPANEAAQLSAASLQNVRFQERRLREAQSDVRNEAVYFSPVIRIDKDTQTAILQYRDSSTGKVEREYPAPPKQGAYQDIGTAYIKAAADEKEANAKVEAKASVFVESDDKAGDQSVHNLDQNA